MSVRVVRTMVVLVLAGSSWLAGAQAQADTTELVTTPLYPGITHIKRTDSLARVTYTCPSDSSVTTCTPGCPQSTTNPRIAAMNILLIDLTSPAVKFKLTPPGENLPPVAPGSSASGWPDVPFEVVKQRTLDFANASHAQAAVNVHFFAPFPVPGGSTQSAFAYVIGFAASRGKVFSAFESPIQNYAIVTSSPAINIDKANNASIVHRDPDSLDGFGVLEDVQIWNAFAGSGQILTNGVKTIPEYRDATHPNELLAPGPNPPIGTPTYSRPCRHWYDLTNARMVAGITQDGKTLVLFSVAGTNNGNGMPLGEIADLLKNEYNVWNALNLDGGGSTNMILEDPVTHVRARVSPLNTFEDRLEASNLAVYSDAVDPVTEAVATPPANANGWNNTNVNVALHATDLASGISDTPVGWVDQLQYSLDGAQTSGPEVVPGDSASIDLSTPGVTTLSYFATDAAGNEETPQALQVRIDAVAPAISGMPAAGCTLEKPKPPKPKPHGKPDPPLKLKHQLVLAATVKASDALSGVLPDTFKVTATSSEPQKGKHPDIVINPDGSGGYLVYLSIEKPRDAAGRIYTIKATASDLADNVQTLTSACLVPKKKPHDDDDDDDDDGE